MSIQDEIPKSRLTLTYKTEVNGAQQDVDLPLRLAILGDFSGGTSKDRQVDLDERRIQLKRFEYGRGDERYGHLAQNDG